MKPLSASSTGGSSGSVYNVLGTKLNQELENAKISSTLIGQNDKVQQTICGASFYQPEEKSSDCLEDKPPTPKMWTRVLPRGNYTAENEYLRFYIEVMEELTAFEWINTEGQMDLPPNRRSGYVDVLGSYIDNCIMPLRRMYSWGIPTNEALDAVSNASPAGVIEVGAGTGYWAMLLQNRGVDIIAYDRTPVEGLLWERSAQPFRSAS
jgi:hypothetical protein